MIVMTDKQQRFVDEYLVDLNATQAAIRAGYKHGDNGRQLLTKTHVSDAIAEQKKLRSERTRITADRVLKELAAIGFSNMGNYITITDGGVVQLDFSELQEKDLRAVAKFTQKHIAQRDDAPDIIETRFELTAKTPALSKIGEHLGMWKAPESQEENPLLALMREIGVMPMGLPKDDPYMSKRPVAQKLQSEG